MIHRLEPEEFANGCAVTRQLVGTNRFWEVVLAQQALEKVLGRSRIPVSLKHHLEHRAVFVHRSPHPVGIAPMSTCISSRCPRESRRGLRWRNPRANSLLNVMHGCESMLETPRCPARTGVLRNHGHSGASVVKPDGVPDDGSVGIDGWQLLIDGHQVTVPQQLARTVVCATELSVKRNSRGYWLEAGVLENSKPRCLVNGERPRDRTRLLETRNSMRTYVGSNSRSGGNSGRG
jgi:hypothetical protein